MPKVFHFRSHRLRRACSGRGPSLIARFMGPTWGPSGADSTQVGPMLAPWTLLSGMMLGDWERSAVVGTDDKRTDQLIFSSIFNLQSICITIYHFNRMCSEHEVRKEIRNSDIRLLYTRIRTDLNILATSRASKKRTERCPLCHNEPETVSHFITRCPVFVTERNNFYDNVSHVSPSLLNKCDNQQLKYILNLRYPPGIINQCCKFVANTCVARALFHIKNIMLPYVNIASL